MSTLQTQVQTRSAQPAIVNAAQSTGLLTDAALPADIALVNTSGQVTTKTGTVVSSGGGGGAWHQQRQWQDHPDHHLDPDRHLHVRGVDHRGPGERVGPPTCPTRVLTSDSRLSPMLALPPPTPATHAVAGSDPITVATSQVSGLAGILSNNSLTSTSNAVNRISSLEGRVTTIEGGGGGGGGGTSTTSVFYDSANTTTEVTDFTQVILHSPWGIDSDGSITGTIDTPYYLHTGVRPADVAYPYISPNGHLNLYRWNESGPADPVYALDSDLTALTTTVGTKANQSRI
jgi:hypothetical protein